MCERVELNAATAGTLAHQQKRFPRARRAPVHARRAEKAVRAGRDVGLLDGCGVASCTRSDLDRNDRCTQLVVGALARQVVVEAVGLTLGPECSWQRRLAAARRAQALFAGLDGAIDIGAALRALLGVDFAAA